MEIALDTNVLAYAEGVGDAEGHGEGGVGGIALDLA